MKESLYGYSDEELSLRVMNEEWLYLRRHTPGFIRELRDMYRFTNAQGADLRATLAADRTEAR